MTLIEFLLARIAEHEASAHEFDWTIGNPLAEWGAYEKIVPSGEYPWIEADPAWVLADCAAKRAIIALWAEEWDDWHGSGSGLVRTRMTDDQYHRVLIAEYVLHSLALPYADHADYDEAWRL